MVRVIEEFNMQYSKISKKILLSTLLISSFLFSLTIVQGLSDASFTKDITSLGQEPYQCGDEIEFELVLSWTDDDVPVEITNLVIVDTLPEGVTYVPSSASTTPFSIPDYDIDTRVLTCDFGSGPFTGDPHATITYSVQVDDVETDYVELSNSASANFVAFSQSWDIPGAKPFRVGCPVIDIQKIGPNTVKNGDPISWTITIENTGHFDAEELRIVDTIPPQVKDITAEETPDYVDGSLTYIGNDEVIWEGTVKTGESAIFTVTGTVDTQDIQIDNPVIIAEYREDVNPIKTEDHWITDIVIPQPVGGLVMMSPVRRAAQYLVTALCGLMVTLVYLRKQ